MLLTKSEILLKINIMYDRVNNNLKGIRSVPGNNVLPVSNSAIMHPTDQISTENYRNYIYL